MPKTTIHDRLVAALLARGETIVADARSTKYTVLTHSEPPPGGFFDAPTPRRQLGFYYVGKAGALRVGRTVATSRPVNEAFRYALLN